VLFYTKGIFIYLIDKRSLNLLTTLTKDYIFGQEKELNQYIFECFFGNWLYLCQVEPRV
jgi:hypothetical protein